MTSNEQEDILNMERAFQLALNGRGSVSPNPMVGCIITKENSVIGEGWHQYYGGPHAEVNAIDSVQDKQLLRGATVYISLEPCSHFGKTPPCANLLASYDLERVVLSNTDPNPLVSGKGISILSEKGIKVDVGILESRGEDLNRRFFTFHSKKRPYIILKWAQTMDGFIAKENYSSKWISNEFSRKLVHKWRSEEDAIMVGTNTAHYDNPRLTSYDWNGKNPVRIVLDPNNRLDPNLDIFDKSSDTIVYNLHRETANETNRYVKISRENFLDDLLSDLYSRSVLSIIVEGGASLHSQLINAGLWDEARVFISPKKFGQGISAASLPSKPVSKETVKGDTLLTFKRPKNG